MGNSAQASILCRRYLALLRQRSGSRPSALRRRHNIDACAPSGVVGLEIRVNPCYFRPYEAKLAAKKGKTSPYPRVSRTPQDENRSSGHPPTHAKGSRTPRSLMPRKFSLTRADFAKTRHFRRVLGTALSLSFGNLPSRSVPGGAIVVSKKVASSAVIRNRIKRSLRAVLSAYLRKEGCPSIIVMVRKNVPTRQLRSELEAVLQKIPRSL